MRFKDPRDLFKDAGDDPNQVPGPPEGSFIKPLGKNWWVTPTIWILLVIACLLFVMIFI